MCSSSQICAMEDKKLVIQYMEWKERQIKPGDVYFLVDRFCNLQNRGLTSSVVSDWYKKSLTSNE